MERIEGAQTPYEVYCYHCRVTFPAEARVCIHCGNRLGSPGPDAAEAGAAAARTPERRPGARRVPTRGARRGARDPRASRPRPSVREEPAARQAPTGLPPGPIPGDEDDEAGTLLMRRFGGLAVWALIALSALLSNLCRGSAG